LLGVGIVVIAVGGGGIPVVDVGDGEYRGVAAVIDKDHAGSLLARSIEADLFIMLTAVEKVALRFGQPEQRWINRMTLDETKKRLNEGIHFAKGSMEPKIEAIIAYLAGGGRRALVTSPEQLGRALKGLTGTWFEP
jgi:carbamate kinase